MAIGSMVDVAVRVGSGITVGTVFSGVGVEVLVGGVVLGTEAETSLVFAVGSALGVLEVGVAVLDADVTIGVGVVLFPKAIEVLAVRIPAAINAAAVVVVAVLL